MITINAYILCLHVKYYFSFHTFNNDEFYTIIYLFYIDMKLYLNFKEKKNVLCII